MQAIRINGTFKESLPWNDVFETQGHSGLMLWRISLGSAGTQHLEISDALLAMIDQPPYDCPENWEEFMTRFVHPDDWAEIRSVFQACRQRPRVAFHFEHRLLHAASGQWRWVRVTAQGKKVNPQGQATKIFGGTLDVHDFYTSLNDLHKVHQQLRRERLRLATIINAADIVIWDWDLDADQRVYGEAWGCRAAEGEEGGGPPAQCVWDQLLAEDDRKRAKLEAERHARGETPIYEMEYQVPRPNGGTLWLQDRGRRVDYSGDGRSRRLMGVMTDITSHKIMESRLRAQSERLELVTRATQTGAWDWNVRANKIAFNEAYALMMGYGPGELDGDLDKWRGCIHPEDLSRLDHHFLGDGVGQERVYQCSLRMLHREGHYINTYSMGRVVDLADGGRAGRIVGIQFEPHKGLVI